MRDGFRMPMGGYEIDVFTNWRHCVKHHGRPVIKKQYRKRERQWINRLLAKDYKDFRGSPE